MFSINWGFRVTVIGEKSPIITASSTEGVDVNELQVLKYAIEAELIKMRKKLDERLTKQSST